MPYATIVDLQDRLGEARLVQLTDRADPPLGVVDVVVAQKALDDADAEIDGYLAGRYVLPLATAPAVLRVHAITIASYRLLGTAAGYFWLCYSLMGLARIYGPNQPDAFYGISLCLMLAGLFVRFADRWFSPDR